MGPNDNQYAILDEDKTGLTLYFLQGVASQEVIENNGALDAKSFADTKPVPEKGPLQFLFETEVDRVFSSPLGKLYNSLHFLDTTNYTVKIIPLMQM